MSCSSNYTSADGGAQVTISRKMDVEFMVGMLAWGHLKRKLTQARQIFQKEAKVMPLETKVRGITTCWLRERQLEVGGVRQPTKEQKDPVGEWGRKIRVTKELEWEEKKTVPPHSLFRLLT